MTWFTILIFIAVLGAGIIAGVFFTFSTFVMKSLAVLSPQKGIAAMQSINLIILKSLFILVFMGTSLLSLVLGIMAILKWGQPGMVFLLVASALFVVGSFLVTMVFNVPLNNELDAVGSNSAEAIPVWERYLSDWVIWNHVRTIASLAASGGFIYALLKFV